MSISLFDPMPAFLLASKPVAAFLPDGTQYIGLYFTLCLVLQGAFGYLATWQALRLVSNEDPRAFPYISAIGGLLIATLPFTFFRFQYHTALSSQWIIVLAMWAALSTVEASRKRWMLVNCSTMLLATGINPYLALMVAMSSAIPTIVQLRTLGWVETSIRVCTLALTAAIGLYLFGFLVATGADSGGYGLFSMNALGPLSSAGLGRINPYKTADPTAYQSLEGFDYLGAGVIVLVVVAIAASFSMPHKTGRFPYWGALLIVIAGYLLALSSTPTFGSHRFHIPIPGSIEFLLSRFRSSGRLFWVAGFWIVVAGIAACVQRWGVRRIAPLLIAILTLQIVDIQPVAFATKLSIANGATQTLLATTGGAVDAILVFPGWQCDHDKTPLGIRNYESIGFFAANHHIPTNNFYAARNLPEQIAYHCDYSTIAGNIRPHALYLVTENIYRSVEQDFAQTHQCNNQKTGDGSWICVPRHKADDAPGHLNR